MVFHKGTYKFCETHSSCVISVIQIFNIVCNNEVLEADEFVNLKQRMIPPSSEQQWYIKPEPAGTFAIISLHKRKALKLQHDDSLQVVFGDITDGCQWKIEEEQIVHKETSRVMYINDNKILYVCNKGDPNAKNKMSLHKVVRCYCTCCA